MSHMTCHVSNVTCHMSLFYKVVEFVGGGSSLTCVSSQVRASVPPHLRIAGALLQSPNKLQAMGNPSWKYTSHSKNQGKIGNYSFVSLFQWPVHTVEGQLLQLSQMSQLTRCSCRVTVTDGATSAAMHFAPRHTVATILWAQCFNCNQNLVVDIIHAVGELLVYYNTAVLPYNINYKFHRFSKKTVILEYQQGKRFSQQSTRLKSSEETAAKLTCLVLR